MLTCWHKESHNIGEILLPRYWKGVGKILQPRYWRGVVNLTLFRVEMGNMLETFSSGGCTPRILETIWKSLHANILVLFFHFLCGMGLACKASFPCMLATIGLKLHFRHIALMKIWGRTKSRDQCTTVPYTYWASTFWNLIHTGENTPQYLTLTGYAWNGQAHIFWHSIWHTLTFCLAFFLTYTLTFCLTVFLALANGHMKL